MIRSFLFLSILAFSAQASTPVHVPPSQAASYFPGADWESAKPESLGWKTEALGKFDEFAFAAPLLTDSVLVIHQGRMVYERYARGYTPQMRHLGWSVTKSLWTTVFAIAETRGLVSRGDSVTKFFPEKKGTAWDEVTLGNLASMTSGVFGDEGYGDSPFRSDIVATLYRGPYLRAKGEYRLRSTKRMAAPGERFAYLSGETNLLSACMKKAMGEAYADFPRKELFDRIGAKSFVLESDESGVYVGSSYSYATPRDYARLGYLFLREGRWAGAQVVPAEWVKLATQANSAFSTLRLDHQPMQPYGHGWWLNTPVPTAQMGKTIASAPADLYWAQGHEGQYVFVIPSLDLVVVRFGRDEKRMDAEKFFRLLMAAHPAAVGKSTGGQR